MQPRTGSTALLALLCLLPATVAAQRGTVAAFPLSGLSFGDLMPGIAAAISPDNAGSRASISLVGNGRTTIVMSLPTALTGPGGAQLPLSFGSTDAAYALSNDATLTAFDPKQPLGLTIPSSAGGATIYLGGLAQPAAGQMPGAYVGKITVNVYLPGT